MKQMLINTFTLKTDVTSSSYLVFLHCTIIGMPQSTFLLYERTVMRSGSEDGEPSKANLAVEHMLTSSG